MDTVFEFEKIKENITREAWIISPVVVPSDTANLWRSVVLDTMALSGFPKTDFSRTTYLPGNGFLELLDGVEVWLRTAERRNTDGGLVIDMPPGVSARFVGLADIIIGGLRVGETPPRSPNTCRASP